MSADLESYPPIFRQENDDDDETQMDDPNKPVKDLQECSFSDPVPLIDLQCINLEELEDACKDWGLFRLVNHGIPLTLMNQLQDQARQLFALSFESKQTLFTSPAASYFWGTPALTPSGAVLARGAKHINWVEGFNVLLGQHLQVRFQAREAPLLDSFRVLLEEYGGHMARIARIIFEAMVKNLDNLDEEKSKPNLSDSPGLLRVYRYPKFSKANEAMGMELHTDSSVLSILNQQNDVGGLQFLRDDKWFQVDPIPYSLVVNLGDMMQAISNDEYMSVKHRVKVNERKERFSICYFVFPEEGSVIRSSKYKPFTYSEFQAQMQRDVKNVGYKIGLQRFKISEEEHEGEEAC